MWWCVPYFSVARKSQKLWQLCANTKKYTSTCHKWKQIWGVRPVCAVEGSLSSVCILAEWRREYSCVIAVERQDIRGGKIIRNSRRLTRAGVLSLSFFLCSTLCRSPEILIPTSDRWKNHLNKRHDTSGENCIISLILASPPSRTRKSREKERKIGNYSTFPAPNNKKECGRARAEEKRQPAPTGAIIIKQLKICKKSG